MIHARAWFPWSGTKRSRSITFFPSDGKTKNNIWLSKPTSDLAKISYKRKEKKQRDNMKKRKEKEECADNQQSAQDEGFCCHHHAKRLKIKEEEERIGKKRAKVDCPDHCIHCDEDPCLFVQIESRLCENNTIYYDRCDYENAPAHPKRILHAFRHSCTQMCM
jgi:hypothetical protein